MHFRIDLTPRPEVIITIDHLQRGLGSASCGPDTFSKYRIAAGRHRFAYEIRPFTGENPAAALFEKRRARR